MPQTHERPGCITAICLFLAFAVFAWRLRRTWPNELGHHGAAGVALVVFLRGVNVGGHRTLRPAALARQLKHLDAINIGAAGTFVIRRGITRTRLRAELTRRLPFDAQITICEHQEIVRLVSRNPFAGQRLRPDVVRFVSVLSQIPRSTRPMPICIPSRGRWLVNILARENRFVVGLYRRHMKTIGCLGTLDRIFGTTVITRNWNTISAIVKVLDNEPPR